jgi:23S rRNA (cytosine1962-C5)-methyltransferase
MDYALLDSGEGEKLERFGEYVIRRPDPQALWERVQPSAVWDACDAWFERKGEKGEWHLNKTLPKEWDIEYGGLTFGIRLTSFKHVGIFPEQLENWNWVTDQLSTLNSQPATILNLFGYTGGASLAAAKAGASVTHIDASKTAVEWGRQNAEKSGLGTAPIRWIVEDTMRFVDRELKRGTKYDGIILDPPAFGHGPKDELWKIEEDLVPLMQKCRDLLTDKPLFVLMNGYAAGYSHFAFEHLLEPIQKVHGGTVDGGELTITEASGRLMPAGIYARWHGARP